MSTISAPAWLRTVLYEVRLVLQAKQGEGLITAARRMRMERDEYLRDIERLWETHGAPDAIGAVEIFLAVDQAVAKEGILAFEVDGKQAQEAEAERARLASELEVSNVQILQQQERITELEGESRLPMVERLRAFADSLEAQGAETKVDSGWVAGVVRSCIDTP